MMNSTLAMAITLGVMTSGPVRGTPAVITVLWAPSVGDRPRVAPLSPTPDSTRTSSTPERLVLDVPETGTAARLPVTIHGHPVTLVLMLGMDDGLGLDPARLAQLGVSLADTLQLDSLTIGPVVEHHLALDGNPFFVQMVIKNGDPPGLPPAVGYVGTNVISHYDVLFDERAKRVRLYAPVTTSSTAKPAWLPPGITASDCTPLLPVANQIMGIPLHVNNHPLVGVLENILQDNPVIDIATARLLGLTQHSPNVERSKNSKKVYRVTGLQVTAATQPVDTSPILIIPQMTLDQIAPTGMSLMLMRTAQFRHRLLFISHSTGQACVTAPQTP